MSDNDWWSGLRTTTADRPGEPEPLGDPEARFDWGTSAPEVDLGDDVVKVRGRRTGWVVAVAAAAVTVAVALIGVPMVLANQPTPTPTPSQQVSSAEPVGPLTVGPLTVGQVAPGFSDTPAWEVELAEGAKVAGTALGMVEVADNHLRLYGPGTGGELFAEKLDDPIVSLTSGWDESTEVLAWLSGGDLHWWSQTGNVQHTAAPWATDLSAAGGHVLISGGGRTATLAGGKLVEFRLPTGQEALGVTSRGVVAAASDGLYLFDPVTSLSERIDLRPPMVGYRPVRWAGLSAGFALVVWSPVANPAPGQPVIVALHSFDGRVTGDSTMPFQVAASAVWLRTTGQLAGTFGTVGFDLVDGTVLVECSTCTLSGGFGPLLVAAQGEVSGLWWDGTLVPSTVEVIAVAKGRLLVRDGLTVYGYPRA